MRPRDLAELVEWSGEFVSLRAQRDEFITDAAYLEARVVARALSLVCAWPKGTERDVWQPFCQEVGQP